MLFVHVCTYACVYLCLAPCALLDEAARQGGRHTVTLKKAANSVAETQSNQLLEKEKQNDRHDISHFTFHIWAEKQMTFDIDTGI